MLGNGHGSGPSLVELGMASERPASAVNTGSAQKGAAGAAGPGPQTGIQKSPKSAGACPCCCDTHSRSTLLAASIMVTCHLWHALFSNGSCRCALGAYSTSGTLKQELCILLKHCFLPEADSSHLQGLQRSASATVSSTRCVARAARPAWRPWGRERTRMLTWQG